MKIRIFNPEHDIALAQNKNVFIPPHAARQLHTDLDFIPAFLSEDGDVIVVNEPERSRRYYEHICTVVGKPVKDITFAALLDLPAILGRKEGEVDKVLSIAPWGIDEAICTIFRNQEWKLDVDSRQIGYIRRISSREWCASHLQEDVVYITDESTLRARMSELRRSVLKAPWSSTGRGVRYVDLDCDPSIYSPTFNIQQINWAVNIIRQQGGIVVEPFYNKVIDFGMEFEALQDGSIKYLGLSLFETVKGAYAGNLIANEADKQEILCRYISKETQLAWIQRIKRELGSALKGYYQGPFGVDFMVVSGKLDNHFDVKVAELNLRHTMGHVALALSPQKNAPQKIMRFEFDGSHHHLRINGCPIREITAEK